MGKLVGKVVGYGFHPNAEELIGHFLRKKRLDPDCSVQNIEVVDIYNYEPHELFGLSKSHADDEDCHFFCEPYYKYGTKKNRVNRKTRGGNWKVQGKKREVRDKHKRVIGWKIILVFYQGSSNSKAARTKFVMHEYHINDDSQFKGEFVVVRIKRNQDTKHGTSSSPNDNVASHHLASNPRNNNSENIGLPVEQVVQECEQIPNHNISSNRDFHQPPNHDHSLNRESQQSLPNHDPSLNRESQKSLPNHDPSLNRESQLSLPNYDPSLNRESQQQLQIYNIYGESPRSLSNQDISCGREPQQPWPNHISYTPEYVDDFSEVRRHHYLSSEALVHEECDALFDSNKLDCNSFSTQLTQILLQQGSSHSCSPSNDLNVLNSPVGHEQEYDLENSVWGSGWILW